MAVISSREVGNPGEWRDLRSLPRTLSFHIPVLKHPMGARLDKHHKSPSRSRSVPQGRPILALHVSAESPYKRTSVPKGRPKTPGTRSRANPFCPEPQPSTARFAETRMGAPLDKHHKSPAPSRSVPQGRLILAQHVSAGSPSPKRSVPKGRPKTPGTRSRASPFNPEPQPSTARFAQTPHGCHAR